MPKIELAPPPFDGGGPAGVVDGLPNSPDGLLWVGVVEFAEAALPDKLLKRPVPGAPPKAGLGVCSPLESPVLFGVVKRLPPVALEGAALLGAPKLPNGLDVENF